MSVRTHSPLRSLDRVVRSCVAAVEGVAFWTSVALPLAYPPLLAATAVSAVGPTLVVAVVLANAAALVAGHGYRPGNGEAATGNLEDRSPTPASEEVTR